MNFEIYLTFISGSIEISYERLAIFYKLLKDVQ